MPLTSPRPISELVRKRGSWRKYQDEELAPELLEQIDEVLASAPPGPFGHDVRLTLLQADPSERGVRKLGTYGVISGAAYFLAGAIEDGPFALEDYGFVFEWVVLQLAGLGLQTCWLGGTFSKSDFGAALHVHRGELVPAVSPVGHAARRRSTVDRVFRLAAGSKHRKPWSELFFDGDLQRPLTEQQGGAWAEVLELVRLAPSASNKQPWRILRDGERWHMLLQRTAGYRVRYVADLQRIDMGIALCHFVLGAEEAGMSGRIEVLEPNLGELPPHTSYVCSWVPHE